MSGNRVGKTVQRLENDIRELRGAEPPELAERLIARGWSLAHPVPEPCSANWHRKDIGRCPVCGATR